MKCSLKFIRENFNLSEFLKPGVNIKQYKSFYGKPSCILKEEPQEKWEFDKVSASVFKLNESPIKYQFL